MDDQRLPLRAVVALFAAALVSACSLENPTKPHGLQIHLEDAPWQREQGLSAFVILAALADPTSSADFNCFAVNITGSGLSSDSQKLSGCQSPTNMHGRGVGTLSTPAPRGRVIELDVKAGTDRTIDVYGLSPATTVPECGGTQPTGGSGQQQGTSGYFLGTKTLALTEATAVTIPISFVSGATADLTCTGPSGGSGGGGGSVTIDKVFPPKGVASRLIHIFGNGFNTVGTTTVTLGGAGCNGVSVVNANELTCTTGSHATGPVDVVVTNPDGTAGNGPGKFEYITGGALYVRPSSYNFGAQSSVTEVSFEVWSPGTTDVTGATGSVSNGGQPSSRGIGALGTGGAFGFSGGSYPGVSGNCGSTIVAGSGSSCIVRVQFIPQSGDSSGTSYSGRVDVGNGTVGDGANLTGSKQ